MVITAKRETKVPLEKLQEEHLVGPASEESIDEVAKHLNEGVVVVATEVPHVEKIVFRNQRDAGHPLEFHFQSRNVPFKHYKLVDGETYTLPIEVIRNLEGCRENVEKYRRNSQGIPEIYVAGYKTHFVCERT